MKSTFFIILIMVFVACNEENNGTRQLQVQIDSLQNRLDNAYKPGMGEIMENIRVHHAKLWYAGQKQNWALANYEGSLIQNGFKRIRKFHAGKAEAEATIMIGPAMDSVQSAILQKNPLFFKRSYLLLTTTCNNCHKATNFTFNDIIIPQTSSFSNQNFKSK